MIKHILKIAFLDFGPEKIETEFPYRLVKGDCIPVSQIDLPFKRQGELKDRGLGTHIWVLRVEVGRIETIVECVQYEVRNICGYGN